LPPLISILSTKILRPETITAFESMGVALEMRSFIKIDYLQNACPCPNRPQALIITSVQGIEGLEQQNFDWRLVKVVFCIKGITEQAVSAKVDAAVPIYSALYASELVALIVQKHKTLPLILVKGNKGLPTIPNGLKAAYVAFKEWIVYENNAQSQQLDKDFDGILFFSPSAVESFVLNNRIKENTITFAIGTTTAAALKKYTPNVVVAATTNELSLAQAVASYFNI
jgi:uroporphyrinogen-III synthase